MIVCVQNLNSNMLFNVLRKMGWNLPYIIFISIISVLPANCFIVVPFSYRFLLLCDKEF
jgi:hypothetical protein